MNRKQASALVLAVSLIAVVSLTVIFPAIYERQSARDIEEAVAPERSGGEGLRRVLPRLKGIRWKAQKEAARKEQKKPAVPEKPPEAAAAKTKAPILPLEPASPADELFEAAKPDSLLELQSMQWYEQGGYVVVYGSVKNVSDTNLASVRAVVFFEDADDNVMLSEYTMLPMNPIFPGQVSPFQVAVRFYSWMDEAKVDFRTFAGESIPWGESESLRKLKEAAEAAEEASGEPLEQPEAERPWEEGEPPNGGGTGAGAPAR